MRIRIGALDYEVEMKEEIPNGEEGFLFGQIDHINCVISIRSTVDEQVQAITFLHEVIHSILMQAGFDKHKESYIEAISCGLVGFARDNPNILMFDFPPME